MSNDKVVNVTVEQVQSLPTVTAAQLWHAGGDHLGALRNGIKCKAQFQSGMVYTVAGEHCKWGSNELVAISVCDLELLSCSIGAAAINDYLKKQAIEASKRRGRETWPDWDGDIGEMNLPHGWDVVEKDGKWWVVKRNSQDVLRTTDTDPREGLATRDWAIISAWALARKDKEARSRMKQHLASKPAAPSTE